MNQRNPFMMRPQSLHEVVECPQQAIQPAEMETKPVSTQISEPVIPSREGQLLAELAFEKKRYAEIELALINQKIGSTQILIMNFELKIQQLKRDLAMFTNDVENKKMEIERLSIEHENRKKSISESK